MKIFPTSASLNLHCLDKKCSHTTKFRYTYRAIYRLNIQLKAKTGIEIIIKTAQKSLLTIYLLTVTKCKLTDNSCENNTVNKHKNPGVFGIVGGLQHILKRVNKYSCRILTKPVKSLE